MANTITKTTILDSGLNLAVLVTIVGDGSGEETGTIIIDRSAFTPAGTKLVVDKVEGMLSGFTARLLLDATTDLEIAALPDAVEFEYCWHKIGGIASGKAGAGVTGDLLITTAGLGAGDRGTITINARKKAS